MTEEYKKQKQNPLRVVPSSNEGSEQDKSSASSESGQARLWRRRKISLLRLLPSALTILAMYFGFTCFYVASTGQNFEFVVALVFGAAFLDMMDGRVARFIRQESSFGEQLDSLADFLNFGIAPAFAMWAWGLKGFGNFGWVMAFFFMICCALRLARFNARLTEDSSYSKKYFEGIPAPAGGLLVLMPMVLSFLGLENQVVLNSIMIIFTFMAGLLMVSSIPTYSLKKMHFRLPRENFLPALLTVSVVAVMIFNFPFAALLLLGVVYLISIPVTAYLYAKKG